MTEGGFGEKDRLEREKNDELELNKSLAKISIKNSKRALIISAIATLITLTALIFSIWINYQDKKDPNDNIIISN